MKYLLTLLFLTSLQVSGQVFLPHRLPIPFLPIFLPYTPCDCGAGSAPDNPLLLRYTFQEQTGRYVYDRSGNERNAFFYGTTSWTTDAPNSAGIVLNGTDAYLRSSAPLNVGTSIVTVLTFLKWPGTHTVTPGQVLFSTEGDGSTMPPGTFSCLPATTSGNIGMGVLNLNDSGNGRREWFAPWAGTGWTNIAAIFDNSTTNGDVKLYYCEEEKMVAVVDDNKNTAGNLATNMLHLGSIMGWWQFSPCTISDFRIYSGELTSDEICYVSKHPDEAGSYTASTLVNGLLDYWPLDETNGVTRTDWVGGNNLTQSGAVLESPNGKMAACAKWNASSTYYLQCADNASFAFTTNSFTISSWIFISNVNSNMNAVTKRNGSHLDFQLLYWATPKRFSTFYSDSLKTVNADALGAPTVSTWYNVVSWIDTTNDTINIQVNAGSTNSASLAGVRQAHTTAPLYFGYNGLTPASYSYGFLDEVHFWNRVLTLAERQALYNNGLGRSVP